MRNSAAFLILFSFGLVAQTVRVPFTGCESSGQTGIAAAPRGRAEVVRVRESLARRLAYYKASVAPGILAPRGWRCLGFSGSSGAGLDVMPLPERNAGIIGSAVEFEDISGSTGSGRIEIAEVLARVFPAQKAFVQSVIDENGAPPNRYVFGPFPSDKLIVQTARLVEYRTAPRSEGLGTMGRFKADDDPIDGVAILEGKTSDLLMLRVRLPGEQRDLAGAIVRQFEER